MSPRSLLLSLAAVGALLAVSAPARAAVQALALVRSDGPVELVCRGATCSAEFSGFCLEPELASPTPQTRYRLSPAPEVRLVGHRADGSTVAFDAAKEIAIKVMRTHVAIRLSVPHMRLLEHKLTRLTVEVGARVTLLPEPEAGETPLGPSEIATITTNLRTLGDRIVDSDGTRMPAARLMERMINDLPPGGRERPEVRAAIWHESIRPQDLEGAPEETRTLVRHVHDFCAFNSANSLSPSMRSCLQSQHDTVMGGLNSDYWNKVKNGT